MKLGTDFINILLMENFTPEAIEVGSLSFRLTRENSHDSLIVLIGNKAALIEGMRKALSSERASARTFHRCPAFNTHFSGRLP